MFNRKNIPLWSVLLLNLGFMSIASATTETDLRFDKIQAHIKQLETEAKLLKQQLAELQQTRDSKKITGIPVVTSAYLPGTTENSIDLSPTGLIVVLPPYNQDLQLLKQKQLLEKRGNSKVVELSGMIETQTMIERGSNGKTSSDIDLSDFELHVASYLSPWVTGFASLKYDNAPGSGTTSRLSNSRVFIDRAFIIVGNLDKSPFYGTIGQRYLPFGQYDNYMITVPLTRTMARIKARQISLSYQHPGNSGLYATVFTFKSDLRVASPHATQLGGSVGHEFQNDRIKTNIGMDYVTNIANGEGFLTRVFNDDNSIVKSVPGIVFHGKVSIDAYTFLAEYVTATTRFDASNLSYNDIGAKPAVLNTAAVYAFESWSKPSEVAVGYAQSKEALGLNFPQYRLSATYNITIFKNTVLSLEYRYDKLYAATNTATAQGAIRSSDGGHTQTVTGQLVYFF